MELQERKPIIILGSASSADHADVGGGGSSSSDSNSEPEPEYYFEKDPLILKNNHDYQKLIRCQLKLQAQRNASVKNLEQLLELWDYGAKNPIEFIQHFSSGSLHVPEAISIEKLPTIDWSKYNLTELRSDYRRNTRTRLGVSRAAAEVAAQNTMKNTEATVQPSLFNTDKSRTFNLPWTELEQCRLNELLNFFPPEHIAANRYRKIAEELGTRTSVQVQSRMQKYGIALKKENIALPGYRNPSYNVMRRPSSCHKKRSNSLAYSRSTFFAPHESDVNAASAACGIQGGREYYIKREGISYNQDDYFGRCEQRSQEQYDSNVKHEQLLEQCSDKEQQWGDGHLMEFSDPENDDEVSATDYIRLSVLRRVKATKKREMEQGVGLHYSYTCCVCNQSPIEGIRYHCPDCHQIKREDSTCNRFSSVDFCSECYQQYLSATQDGAATVGSSPLLNTIPHIKSHRVQAMELMDVRTTIERLVEKRTPPS